MLGVLRRKRNSPIILFLLVLIILVFIAFFGPAMDNIMNERLYAAKVDGEVITDREFAQRYASSYRQYQQQFREFNRDQAREMKLKEKVLDQLVTSRVLANLARDRGMAVDDAALRAAILENPNFQSEGRFDKNLYERILNSAQMSPPDFEAYMREQLLQEKLATIATSALSVSSNEVRRQYEADQRSMSLEFIKIEAKGYEGQVGAVSAADVDAWKKRDDAEEEIKKYYQKNARNRYNVPKKVRARHILVRVDKKAPPDLIEEARNKIREARKAVAAGTLSFEDAAKKYSDDSTKDRGGDLGYFSRGQMVSAFEEAAFGMQKGEMSEIIQTPFGFHVIKLEDIQEPITRKLEDVKDEIAMELAKIERAADLAKTRAQRIHEQMAGGTALADIVAESAEKPGLDPAPLKAEETGSFTQARPYVPKIGTNKELSAAAWKLTLDKPYPAGPFRLDDGWVVFKVKDRTEPTKEEFESALGTTRARMAYKKRNDVLDEWAKQVRAGARIETHPLATSYDEDARTRARGRGRGAL